MIFLSFSLSPLISDSVVVRALIVVARSLPPAVLLLLIRVLTLFVFVVLPLFLTLLRALVPICGLLHHTIFISGLVEVVANRSITASPS